MAGVDLGEVGRVGEGGEGRVAGVGDDAVVLGGAAGDDAGAVETHRYFAAHQGGELRAVAAVGDVGEPAPLDQAGSLTPSSFPRLYQPNTANAAMPSSNVGKA